MATSTKIRVSQLRHFFQLEEKGLVTRSNFQQYLEGLSRPIEANQKEDDKRKSAVYLIAVDYGQTLAEMIEVGNYDWKHPDITSEHFPVTETGKQEVETVLVHLNKVASTEQVLQHLDSLGLRPATIAELLAFGAKHTDVQRKFPVIAFGSVWVRPDGNRHVPYLLGDGRGRDLRLDWCGGSDWDERCRFLAVSK